MVIMMERSNDQYSRVDYRRFVAWGKRIEREAPFLHALFAAAPARRLLDLGCGTGEHSRYLASQGFSVVGVDQSQSMIEAARAESNPSNVEFVLGDLADVASLVEGQFGGAICLGNTLPHITDRARLEAFVRGLRRMVLPLAPVLLQTLNYERILSQRERHLALNFKASEDGELVFLRLMDPQPDGSVIFTPSTLRYRSHGDPALEVVNTRNVSLQGWKRDELVEVLKRAGFLEIEEYGSMESSSYHPAESGDLVLVAR